MTATSVDRNTLVRGAVSRGFPRLAAALNLETLDDEDKAVKAVEQLRRNALAAEQERDIARTELATVTADRDALVAMGADLVETAINDAYRSGKLLYGRDDDGNPVPSAREARLRRLGSESLEELRAEIAEMPVLVPLNKRVIANDGAPRRRRGDAKSTSLAAVAAQLGHDPDELVDHAETLGGA